MLTVPGKISSISLNSLLVTLDGSVLLAVWPGFLQINCLFRKVIWKMLRLHSELALSVTGWRRDRRRGSDTPKVRRDLLATQGDALSRRTSSSASPETPLPRPSVPWSLEKEQAQTQGALHLLLGGEIKSSPPASVHLWSTCVAMNTLVWVYTVDVTLVGWSALWQVLKLTQKKREDRIPFVPP